MDKKTKKKLSSTPRESFSLDDESIEIINEEVELTKGQTGYKPSRSAIVRKAIQLLKEHREKVQNAKIAAENSARQKIEKATSKKK